MARSDARRTRDDWSCSLCTLLNGWQEKVCEACGNERTEEAEERSPSSDRTSVKREFAADSNHDSKPPANGQRDRFMGVFFVSSSTTNDWMHAPRLRLNRKRPLVPSRDPGTATSTTLSASIHHVDIKPVHSPPAYTTTNDSTPRNGYTGMLLPGESPSPKFEQDDDLPDAPTFNLLGFQQSTVPANQVDHTIHDDPAQDDGPSFSLLGNSTIDLTSNNETESQRPDTEFKLKEAGLDLSESDSDNDSGQLRRKLRREDQPVQDPALTPAPTHAGSLGSWECEVCTEPNEPHAERCCLCESRRPRSSNVRIDSTSDGYAPAEDNPRFGSDALTSTSGDQAAGGMQSPSREYQECHICTHVNSIDAIQCELCEITLRGSPERPRRLESNNDVVDFARGSSPVRYNNYESSENEFDPRTYQATEHHDFDDDFEERYIQTNYDPQPRYRDDYVEDISDNEMYGGGPRGNDNQPPPKSRRQELHGFEHFRTVDDARLDGQCHIDYRSMFAESSCSRSYADRDAKRRRESQKRKRSLQQNQSTHNSGKPTKQTKKAKAAKTNAKKAKATPRRASSGKTARKPRQSSSQPRRSSAPSFSSSSVNHYDSTLGEIDEGVTTMAWEGVGSAGYF